MGKHENLRNDSESVDIYSSAKIVKKKKKNRKKKAVITLLSVIIVLCVVLGAGITAIVKFSDYYNDVRKDVDEENLSVNNVDTLKGIKNIALFGVDSRSETGITGRSDTIIIVSVNTMENKVKLISVMRDSVAKVDGQYTKINAAYAKGGAELAIRTLNENFELDITDYATVNFVGLSKIIDMVGGVECEVTQEEIDHPNGLNVAIDEQNGITGEKTEHIKTPGLQLLNGVQATAWARIRYVKTAWGERDDYGRTARQRYVLQQLFQKGKKVSIFKYPALVKTAINPEDGFVETSLNLKEVLSIAKAVRGATMEEARIPYDNCTMTNTSGVTGAVYFSRDYARQLIKAFIYDNTTFAEYVEQNPIDYTPWVK